MPRAVLNRARVLREFALSAGSALVFAGCLAAQDQSPRSVADPELQHTINDTVDRATAYLKKAQHEDGRWIYDFGPYGRSKLEASNDDYTAGLSALALYALASSGLPPTDAAARKGLAWCVDNKALFVEGKRATYSASLLVLALTRLDAKAHKKWIHELAKRIEASQLSSGIWNYELRANRGADTRKSGESRWAASPWQADGDNSNSQFAVLALWAAQSMTKYRVSNKTWKKVRDFYARTQQPDGGWSYREPKAGAGGGSSKRPGGLPVPLWMYKSKASMTAAGLVSFTSASAALAGGSKAIASARKSKTSKRGLDTFLADRKNWDEMFWDYYYAYSVERVGTMLGVATDEWYTDGARYLTARQRSDGRWSKQRSWRRSGESNAAWGGRYGDSKQVYETSLALLFLAKATAYPITPRKTGR